MLPNTWKDGKIGKPTSAENSLSNAYSTIKRLHNSLKSGDVSNIRDWLRDWSCAKQCMTDMKNVVSTSNGGVGRQSSNAENFPPESPCLASSSASCFIISERENAPWSAKEARLRQLQRNQSVKCRISGYHQKEMQQQNWQGPKRQQRSTKVSETCPKNEDKCTLPEEHEVCWDQYHSDDTEYGSSEEDDAGGEDIKGTLISWDTEEVCDDDLADCISKLLGVNVESSQGCLRNVMKSKRSSKVKELLRQIINAR